MSLLSELLERELPAGWWTTPVNGVTPEQLVADYEAGKCATSYGELVDRVVALSEPGQCTCGHLQGQHRRDWNPFRGWQEHCDTCLVPYCGQGRNPRGHGHIEKWCPCTEYQEGESDGVA